MKFTERNATHPETGTEARMWFPDSLHFEQEEGLTEIHVGRETRIALANLVQLTETFTKQHELRTRLGHDCAVFAYAHESGDDLTDIPFCGDEGNRLGVHKSNIKVKGNENPSNLADVKPGEIVFTKNSNRKSKDFFRAEPHFLVKATVDDGEPLYLSKLGTRGRVVLSTIEQSLQIYPAQTLGTMSKLYIEPPDKPA